MGQDALIKALIDETRREEAHILREAEEEGRRLIADARAESESEGAERVASLRRTLRKRRTALVNKARASARGRVLIERSRAVEEVLRVTQRGVGEMGKGEYEGLIARFYEELRADWVIEMGGSAHEVRVNPSDVALVKALVTNGAVVVADETVSAGVVFMSADGRVKSENTFSTRLLKARDLVVREVDGCLFG